MSRGNRLAAAFAAALTGAAAIGVYELQARKEAAGFNPVRAFLEGHNLMEDAKADKRLNEICVFNSAMMNEVVAEDRAWLKKKDGLMATFYFCNALGYEAYRDIPYNDDVVSPPPGSGRDGVKARNASRVMRDIEDVCRVSREQGDITPFDSKMCAAAGYPGLNP